MGHYFAQMRRSDLLDSHSKHLGASVSSYGASVWQRYASEILANRNSEQLANFQYETHLFFEQQQLSKVTIFSTDITRLFYGSNSYYVATPSEVRTPLFDLDKVHTGQIAARLLTKAYIKDSPEAHHERVMVQLILPILRPGAKQPDAFAEIYVDVTDRLHQINMLKYLVIGTMVGTFAMMIGILLYTANRAESIITKQHEVNLELIAAASQAEAQSNDKSQFLASVSHELRTPLNAIIGFSEILRNEVKVTLDRVYQEAIDDIYASGKHLLSLINDILDYSKAEAGKLQVEWAETDTTKVIRNSLRMVMPRAEAAQVMLIEDIPSDHLVVVTDAKKLKQVLLNLLSNAVKFTPAGGEVRCQAWADVTTGSLTVTVKDTGIGIAPKDISKVMMPFGQVESALSRKYEGTGLGLPLAKKFIESMGGEFSIVSELGVGTAVTLRLPKSPPRWSMEDYTAVQEEETHVAPANETSHEHA